MLLLMKCRNYTINNNVDDLYFKILIFYNAKTEMYDRSLTDMRSPYDHTEAYIIGELRSRSIRYACRLYSVLKQYIEMRTNKFNICLWNTLKIKYNYYSAQKWIDIFNYFHNENDNDMKNIEKYIDKSTLCM